MSLILLDPSESKKGTRLPQNVIEAGRVLNELEEATGADILLSPLSIPIKELKDDASFNLLRRHIEAGLLLQRKTGRDAVSSIPDYPAILQRMLEHTCRPYLITIGQYGSNKEGNVIVDGQETEWSWNAYMGALDAWQYRGGSYTNLSRDGQLLPYLYQWIERLSSDEWVEGTVKHIIHPRPPKQVLSKPDWVSVVLSLSIGFGADKVEWLHDNFVGLGDFFSYFSDESNVKSEVVKAAKGIGSSHFRKVRALLNIESQRHAMCIYDTTTGEE